MEYHNPELEEAWLQASSVEGVLNEASDDELLKKRKELSKRMQAIRYVLDRYVVDDVSEIEPEDPEKIIEQYDFYKSHPEKDRFRDK